MSPEEFRKIRKAARMTQAQMATHLGVSRLTINNWETGKFRIPDDALDTLTEKGVSPGTPKETAKQQAERLAFEQKAIAHWVDNYSRLRAWPNCGNHTKAMAVYAREGTVIPAIAYPAIVAKWPDILTDPNGDYTMTKEQSQAAILNPTTNQEK